MSTLCTVDLGKQGQRSTIRVPNVIVHVKCDNWCVPFGGQLDGLELVDVDECDTNSEDGDPSGS